MMSPGYLMSAASPVSASNKAMSMGMHSPASASNKAMSMGMHTLSMRVKDLEGSALAELRLCTSLLLKMADRTARVEAELDSMKRNQRLAQGNRWASEHGGLIRPLVKPQAAQLDSFGEELIAGTTVPPPFDFFPADGITWQCWLQLSVDDLYDMAEWYELDNLPPRPSADELTAAWEADEADPDMSNEMDKFDWPVRGILLNFLRNY